MNKTIKSESCEEEDLASRTYRGISNVIVPILLPRISKDKIFSSVFRNPSTFVMCEDETLYGMQYTPVLSARTVNSDGLQVFVSPLGNEIRFIPMLKLLLSLPLCTRIIY